MTIHLKKIFSLVCINLFLLNTVLPAFCQTVVEENNYLKIERTDIALKSRLSQSYIGYEYKIQNLYKEPVKIKSVMLWNDSGGQAAFLSVQRSNKQVKSALWQKGKSLALPTLSLSLLASAVSMPFATTKNSIANKNAKAEAIEFSKPNIQNEIIPIKKELNIKTLTYKGHHPIMRLVFENPLTDEDMTILMK